MHDPGRGPEEGQSQKGEEVSTHVTTQHAVVAAMASMASRRRRRGEQVPSAPRNSLRSTGPGDSSCGCVGP